MKQIWVNSIPYNKDIITTSLENGATGVLIENKDIKKVRELGRIMVISDKDGDLKIGKDVHIIEIKNKQDEEQAAAMSKRSIVIVKTTDWTIIPLENLIAQGGEIFASVSSEKEALTALEVLEKGVAGILIDQKDPKKVRKILTSAMSFSSEKYSLEEVVIKSVEPLGLSDRVCIDTTTNMKKGEGMLTGNSASCLFLVHSESIDNPYVEARPFRVNAGAVHAYILTPGNKTRYLSELKSGNSVLIVNQKGETFISYVGRVKIEKRPMLLVNAAEQKGDKDYSVVLQNAETIRLTRKNGTPVSVVHLKKGDKVLAYIETQGRHFGVKIQETITEN
ncbi:MAG: 3-dehydroquinate synthase II [Spirochaetes bacterium]|nr:3-dehydroquinate synthase II [Spirochaetota bacterium]